MDILIAEDDAGIRRLFCTFVERLGHTPIPAVDGVEAWALLDRPNGARIALIDWMMPGLDGVELCRRTRARPDGASRHLIMLTARGSSADVTAGLRAGANDYLVKPPDFAILQARLEAAVRMTTLQAEAERSRAYLAAVLGEMEIGALLSDPEGRIVFANPAMQVLSRTPLSQIVGAVREDFIRAHAGRFADPGVFAAVLAGNAAPAVGQRAEFVMDHPERQVIEWRAVPVTLGDGAGRLDFYRDVTAERARAERESQAARTDALTGLANRRGADEFLAREHSRMRRHGRRLSLLLIDVDHFKRVNDQHGHAVGDLVLRELAGIVARQVRASDLAARWGGEEILVALPETNIDGARTTAERIRAAVAAHRATELPPVTVSIGTAEVDTSPAGLAEAIRRADALLYEAKAAGRNRVG